MAGPVPEADAPFVKVHAAAAELLPLVEACVARHDTDHPVFHGCIDWHSSVHGHWALLWGAHVTGDDELARRTLAHLTRRGLQRELADLRRRDAWGARFEMPYGRAWFLQLARDAEALHGSRRLRPLADHVFATLLDHQRGQGGSVTSSRYDNASWALFQLLRWAEHEGDDDAVAEIRRLVRARFAEPLDWPAHESVTGFLDPELLAALVLAAAAPDTPAWSAIARAHAGHELTPVRRFPTAHAGGLNFSRAWGLWALHAGPHHDPASARRLRASYDDHVRHMLAESDGWSRDYRRYGHWVAQFGVFALRVQAELPAGAAVTEP